MENLSKVSHKLAEEMYKNAGAAAGAGPTPGPEAGSDRGTAGAKKDDDVIDAEYEVKE
jgi:molecular chaperone DnaK